MVSDELAPLQTHVEAQIKHLAAVAGVVRELQSAEEQYGRTYVGLPFEVLKSTIQRIPQLQGVSQGFGNFVQKCSEIKTNVAQDLMNQVIAPLEAFTADHVEKAQHLLSELYELLQKEKAFDLAYQNLREGCKDGETSQETSDESELQLHRMHRDQLLHKRDTERLAIQQWITALHFSGQRYEAHVRDVLHQTRAVYERMISSLTALISQLQEQLNQDAGTARTINTGDKSSAVSDESWETFLEEYDCHVAITGWMSELFRQLIPLEQTAAKALHKAVKLDRASSKTFGGMGLNCQLSGLIEFHGLLTVNIANPILRTLKFTKERQERMRNELSKSLEETRTLVVAARAQLDARVLKDDAEEKDPVRCDSLTSSETSDCSLEESNEENENSGNSAPNEEENTPEQMQVEKLRRKLALQKLEMTRVLEQTSFLAVKTMELMVQDYVKHVSKALAALSEAIRVEHPETQRSSRVSSSPRPWEDITERLSIAVSDKPGVPVAEMSDNQQKPKDDTANRRVRRTDCKNARSNREPSGVQVLLSFVQSVVGAAWWAASLCFRIAKAPMPHSFGERAVLVIITVAILTLTGICVKSHQLQYSWSNLTDTQHSNSQDLVQIVKLATEVCTQQLTQ
ncbi:hypothetical protein F442_19674 [Phytophthora nicotianae P10297]|uniref:Uncharacterized protein n=1 Tax=Phytophthora nicotianae P10297 TaxID=1317064 RepID=W2Y9P6_PHYNI|nr:hypothetical protein F442_19674 [Phytophthora nicotianae P10297]